jgi:uncharacterized phage infection (PIP) family protein YhgE
MSDLQPQDAALDPEPGEDADRPESIAHVRGRAGQPGLASTKTTQTVRSRGLPIVITVVVLSGLAAFFLGGTLKPTANLRHFPIAVVNEDGGPVGKQVANGLAASLGNDKFDVRMLSRQEARHQLNTARVYGAALIPSGFSQKLHDFALSAFQSRGAPRPVITISTNPRAGTLGADIAGQAFTGAMSVVGRKIGQQLVSRAKQQPGAAPLTDAVMLALANPIQTKSVVHRPLPDGTAHGLSAFYYSLLLLLAGVAGSIAISTVVDSMFGDLPAKFGAVYRLAEQVNVSRLRALLIKWAMMVVLALLVSAAYIGIARALGMPGGHGWELWLYGVFAIVAVGVTSTSLIAALSTWGLLISMLVFVILGLPLAGAAVPLEAEPSLFGWLAEFEPMHQVFLGVRALLYFDGDADTGLSGAVTMTAIGLVLGLLLGVIVTRVYDRRDYHRIPGALDTANARE